MLYNKQNIFVERPVADQQTDTNNKNINISLSKAFITKLVDLLNGWLTQTTLQFNSALYHVCQSQTGANGF